MQLNQDMNQSIDKPFEVSAVRSRPLVGSFEENILNNRLSPIRTVDGYVVDVRASSSNYQPKPFRSSVCVSFYSAGDSFPYLGRLDLGQKGYKIPRKGTLQVTLYNPNGMVVKLFVLFYDLTDMPPDSQTFLRQKTVYLRPKNGIEPINSCQRQSNENSEDKLRVQYMIQLNIVSSKTGRIYLSNNLRLFISRKVDLETAFQISQKDIESKNIDEMPNNPRYFTR